jgi:hypothetical protein
MQTTEHISTDYCVLPQFITTDNMFDGTQYYNTTEHLLGITDNPDGWIKHRIYDYNNSVFKGSLGFEHSSVCGSLLTYAQIGEKEFYSCNGLCEPERSTQILDVYKKVKEFCGKEYFGKYYFEEYMMTELLKCNKK